MIRGRRDRVSFLLQPLTWLSLKRIRDSYFKNNFVIMKERQTHIKILRNPCALRSPFFFVRWLIIRFCFKTINFNKILFLISEKHNIFGLRKCFNYWSWLKSAVENKNSPDHTHNLRRIIICHLLFWHFSFFYDIFFLGREKEKI